MSRGHFPCVEHTLRQVAGTYRFCQRDMSHEFKSSCMNPYINMIYMNIYITVARVSIGASSVYIYIYIYIFCRLWDLIFQRVVSALKSVQ